MAESASIERCDSATPSLLPTVIEEMEEMFLGLVFSQMVAMKLVDNQETDSPQTLASLSNQTLLLFVT